MYYIYEAASLSMHHSCNTAATQLQHSCITRDSGIGYMHVLYI